MSCVDAALLPGAFLVDAFPMRKFHSQNPYRGILPHYLPTVKYVPAWFPGAGFKKFARIAKENIDNLVNLPFQHVKESFQVREPRLIV